MKCSEVTEFIADYLAGELPPAVRVSFNLHLALCSACRKYLDGYRKTIALAKTAAGNPAAPDEIPEELVAAILKAKGDSCTDI